MKRLCSVVHWITRNTDKSIELLNTHWIECVCECELEQVVQTWISDSCETMHRLLRRCDVHVCAWEGRREGGKAKAHFNKYITLLFATVKTTRPSTYCLFQHFAHPLSPSPFRSRLANESIAWRSNANVGRRRRCTKLISRFAGLFLVLFVQKWQHKTRTHACTQQHKYRFFTVASCERGLTEGA